MSLPATVVTTEPAAPVPSSREIADGSVTVGASFWASKVISSGASLDDKVPSDTVTPIVVLVDVSASLFSAVAPSAVSVTSPVPASIAKYPSSLPLVIA